MLIQRKNKKAYTSRGFRNYAEIKSPRGLIEVRESSLYGEGPNVWIFQDNQPGGIQIDYKVVDEVISALKLFKKEAEKGLLTETIRK